MTPARLPPTSPLDRAVVPRDRPIAVVAPSSADDPARLEAGLAIAAGRGYDLRPLPGLLDPVRYLAASDEVRLSHLVEAFTSPEFGAVWAVRGGFGLTRLLHRIPWEILEARPFIGFSDATPLLEALRVRVRAPCIHGPVLHSLPITGEPSVDHLFALLDGHPSAPLTGETWVPGLARGPLVGGNLCLLASTCGTPFQIDARGAILVLEDVDEAPYRVDRALQQLASAGALDGVAGFALGTFLACEPPEGAAWTLKAVLLDHLGALGVPVVANLPIGHGEANHAFPVGAAATLENGAIAWD